MSGKGIPGLAAASSGFGQLPGAEPLEVARLVVGELSVPYLPLLPERGAGASDIGRTGALLTDVALEVGPHGFRVAAAAGADHRRAAGFLAQDVDALEEALERAGRADGVVCVEILGPLSLATAVELANGHQMLSDRGALRDLAASLAEGLAAQVAQLRRRLRSDIVVRLAEPALERVLGGEVPTVSGLTRLPALPRAVAVALLEPFAALGAAGLVFSCGLSAPALAVLRELPAAAVWVSVAQLTAQHYDALGWFFEAGRAVGLGLVPAQAPAKPPSVAELVAPAAALVDQLGFSRSVLAEQVFVTPQRGVAPKDAAWALPALRLTREVAGALVEVDV